MFLLHNDLGVRGQVSGVRTQGSALSPLPHPTRLPRPLCLTFF